MYGVPAHLPLARFVGCECHFIGIGAVQIQFHFLRGENGEAFGSINPEGKWELRDQTGAIIDESIEHSERRAYRVHKIIGLPVVGFALDPPRSFTLYFSRDYSLTIYDDNEHYESFSLVINGEPSYHI